MKGEKSIITPERFAKLTEAGFVFEAKKRRGKRSGADDEGVEPAMSQPQTAASIRPTATSTDDAYESEGSSGDEHRGGIGAGFESQNVHNSFRNYAYDARNLPNTFSPWDNYTNNQARPP